MPVTVGPARTSSVWVGDRMLGRAAEVAAGDGFVHLELSGRVVGLGGLVASTEHWLTPPKDAALPRATVSIVGVERTGARTARVTLRSDRTAAFVTLESPSVVGAFSDGGFLLRAGEERTLEFEARTDFAVGVEGFEMLPGLRVRSLRDTYVE